MAKIVLIVSFIYYAALSSKVYTWLFVSVDSGDWLAASTIWFVPQPLGSPLYVLLGHVLNLLPGDLVIKETILLSALPSAITVALVYMIVRHLTSRSSLALTASAVLLGAGLFLTQSTILEQYTLAVMFVMAGFWFYLQGRMKLTLLMMGLGTATHVMVLPITLIWWAVERENWREWLRLSWVYIIVGIVPYSMVLVLMALHSPPFIAGYLNWESISGYFFNTAGAIVGTISVYDFPRRLYTTTGMLMMSLGLALVPAVRAMMGRVDKARWIMIGTVGFALWYHMTNIDAITWTFLTFALPFVAILAAVGLMNRKVYQWAVTIGACVLILVNATALNASLLAQQNPQAQEVKAAYEMMPQESVVVVSAGSYALGLFYTMVTERPDLAPIVYWTTKTGRVKWYDDYAEYMGRVHGLEGETPRELMRDAFEQDRRVYIADDIDKLEGEWGLEEWKGFVQELDYRRKDNSILVPDEISRVSGGRVRRVMGFL